MSAPFFKIDVSYETPAKLCVVVLTGKLDALATEEFESRINKLRQEGNTRFVIDLSKLDYVGSLGLRVFVALHNEVHANGGVVVCGVSQNVRSVFAITRLDKLLKIYPTRHDAVDALRTQ